MRLIDYPASQYAATPAVFLPDGSLLSADYAGRIIQWHSAIKSRVLFQLPGAVSGLALAPDGRHLATAN